MSATHWLKVQPPYFQALLEGDKTFEVRRNDRGFQAGDYLLLQEYDPAGDHDRCSDPQCTRQRFTGREITRRVGYVYGGDPRFGGIVPGFVVLSLVDPS